MEELQTEFVPTKRVEANRTIVLHLLPCQASSSTNPTEVCLLATLTACTPGGIRKSTCSSGAVLGEHVKAPPPNLFLFSLSLSLSLVFSNWLPRTDLERLLHAEPGMKITRPQKSSALQSFSLYATYHFSVMSNGLMTTDSSGL